MCRDETMMRMSGIEDGLLRMLEEQVSRGLESVDAAEMGEVVDMLKDVGEAKYYCSIVLAMQDEGEPMGYEPMGYNPRRYADGRYAPKGRGSYGYEPSDAMEARGGMVEPMGYERSREGYRNARMGYEQSRTSESRRAMESAADQHVEDMKDSMREIWGEADMKQRQKMKASLQALLNEMK